MHAYVCAYIPQQTSEINPFELIRENSKKYELKMARDIVPSPSRQRGSSENDAIAGKVSADVCT